MDYIDLSYQFGILRASTFYSFKCFFTKINRFYKILTNASGLFSCKFFFTKIVFLQKKCFMLKQTSWGYCLDYIDLPYQFGILIMSTFCWTKWFSTKANSIYAIWTNVSPVFFAPPLRIKKIFIDKKKALKKRPQNTFLSVNCNSFWDF